MFSYLILNNKMREVYLSQMKFLIGSLQPRLLSLLDLTSRWRGDIRTRLCPPLAENEPATHMNLTFWTGKSTSRAHASTSML